MSALYRLITLNVWTFLLWVFGPPVLVVVLMLGCCGCSGGCSISLGSSGDVMDGGVVDASVRGGIDPKDPAPALEEDR